MQYEYYFTKFIIFNMVCHQSTTPVIIHSTQFSVVKAMCSQQEIVVNVAEKRVYGFYYYFSFPTSSVAVTWVRLSSKEKFQPEALSVSIKMWGRYAIYTFL